MDKKLSKTVTVTAIETFQKYLADSFALVQQFLQSIPPVIPQIFEKYNKMFTTSCLLTILTNQNVHEQDIAF